MLRLILAISVLMMAYPAWAGKNCTCRYKGNDVEEGQTTCMKTPNGMKMALCSRVLNNTSWIFLEQECPTAILRDVESPIKEAPKTVPLDASSSG